LFMHAGEKKYFDIRRDLLIAKREREVLAYSDAAFAYVRRITEINQELQDLDNLENEKN